MLTTFPLQIQNSWKLSILEITPCCIPACNIVTSSTVTSAVPPHCNTVTSPWNFSDLYTSIVLLCLPFIDAAFQPHPCLQTSYPPSAHSLFFSSDPSPLSLVPGCSSTPPASSPHPRSLSGFSNGMLVVSEPGALNCSFLFGPILLTSSVPRNPILTHLPLRIAGFSNLRSDLTHPRSDILSRGATHASSGIIIFVRQGFSFTELSLSLLDPYSDYIAVNISLNNSCSLSFLSVYAPYTRSSPSDGRTDSFSSFILPSSRNLFILGDFNCNCPLWDSRDTSDPREEEVFNRVIYTDLLPSQP